MKRIARIGLTAISLLMGSHARAFADAIDGTWCSERDHRPMTITGPDALLSGGRHVTGDYSRHRFSFTIPLPDAEAGRVMMLRLMGERLMVSITAAPDGSTPSEPEQWKRCELTS